MNNLEEQKRLASIIKGIHQDLRELTKQKGPEDAWKCHLQNKEKLDLYAKTMKKLSEQYWKQKNKTALDDRIKWIINYSEFYFQEMENYRRKDLGTIEKLRNEGCQIEMCDFKDTCSVDLADDLQVLDVGSNGNFFKEHKRFKLTPIDIAPSTDDCFYCDFLTVPLNEKLIIENNQICSLPKDHYNIVLFCLLLEYLPTSEMRIKCCEKAYQVLKTEGILIIITPDSSAQHRNSSQIKNWKYTLAMIGFKRIKIEKLKNLSCMAFRKSLAKEVPIQWTKSVTDMHFKLEIPQDKKQQDNPDVSEDGTQVLSVEYELNLMNSEMPFDF